MFSDLPVGSCGHIVASSLAFNYLNIQLEMGTDLEVLIVHLHMFKLVSESQAVSPDQIPCQV